MSEKESMISARDRLTGEVRKFMVGPAFGIEEQLNDKPWEFYHTGMLWPSDSRLSEEEDDQAAESSSDDEGNQDGFLNMANCAQQSAMGMTFYLSSDPQKITISANWGTYILKSDKEDSAAEKADEDNETWEREHHEFNTELSIEAGIHDFPENLMNENGVLIKARLRKRKDHFILTLVIINNRKVEKSEKYDRILYQSELKATTDGKAGIITPPFPDTIRNESDFWLYELIYRKSRLHAVGHGCSVDWDSSDPVKSVRTAWIPEEEVFKASTEILEGDEILNLEYLSDEKNREEICESLSRLPEEYEKWIEKRDASVDKILKEFTRGKIEIKNAAMQNLRECRLQLSRIREGIRILKKDNTAWTAFVLANQTIAESMKKKRPESAPQWRGFQLAFILLSFPSSIYPDNEYRNSMDLIWFPTGGGKTEAYLGLAAMAVFHRSLSRGDNTGTIILTRYTLRLLTIQQFERAAAMICAANLVKNRHERLKEFSDYTIGLFVGGAATPNNLEKAEEILNNPESADNCTTLPIRKCPWCGSELARHIPYQELDFNGKRLITRCTNTGCEFAEGLPLKVVDEEIYADPPTIIIGTVDKFASMAWEPAMKSIFGIGQGTYDPPDLIIQDELHLITNALGTVTALYETAIDYLCRRDGSPVKIIGSTATIRRASEQTGKLFNREALQFPPSGTDADDSFFYRTDTENPGRTYLGIHAQGRSPKHSLARLAGNCVQSNMSQPEELKDLFYTLVMYFNSMRELGGALVLLEDDVPRYLRTLPGLDENSLRSLPQKKELTSQLSSEDIPKILNQLEISYHSESNDNEPVDAVLATNMISVGMDVDRLGLMIVNGQPKNTSEYIQASSRVGRRSGYPGVVFTLYNWTRPRDRSHYERFKAFHQAFYKHVESTGVTPFAARARDRALHAVLFSLARQTVEELGPVNAAGKICENDVYQKLMELKKIIVSRVKSVDPSEVAETDEELEEIIDDWKSHAENYSGEYLWSVNRKNNDQAGKAIMKRPGEVSDDKRIPVPTSMREVEPSTSIRLVKKGAY